MDCAGVEARGRPGGSGLHGPPRRSASPAPRVPPPQDAQAQLQAGKGAGPTDLPKAAKNWREIEAVLEEVDLSGIEVVDNERCGRPPRAVVPDHGGAAVYPPHPLS